MSISVSDFITEQLFRIDNKIGVVDNITYSEDEYYTGKKLAYLQGFKDACEFLHLS